MCTRVCTMCILQSLGSGSRKSHSITDSMYCLCGLDPLRLPLRWSQPYPNSLKHLKSGVDCDFAMADWSRGWSLLPEGAGVQPSVKLSADWAVAASVTKNVCKSWTQQMWAVVSRSWPGRRKVTATSPNYNTSIFGRHDLNTPICSHSDLIKLQHINTWSQWPHPTTHINTQSLQTLQSTIYQWSATIIVTS